jgi:hypothetical protein
MKKFGSRKKPNQEKDMAKIQCFNCQIYGHYMNHCPKLKKRKETDEEKVAEEKEPSKKVKQNKTNFFFKAKVTIFFKALIYIMFIQFLYISCISIS